MSCIFLGQRDSCNGKESLRLILCGGGVVPKGISRAEGGQAMEQQSRAGENRLEQPHEVGGGEGCKGATAGGGIEGRVKGRVDA